MAVNELAVKFSNEKYATKQDVIDIMRTPLIDTIWNNILEYRSNFNYVLSLKHITGTSYGICLTPSISQKINAIERKFNRLVSNYNKLVSNQADNEFKNISYGEILGSIAKKYDINADKSLLSSIINKQISILPPDTMILNRYNSCLKSIENNFLEVIDDRCLGEYYTYLMGSEELNEFYRIVEVDNSYSKVLIGRLYIGVPCNAIEKSMDDLFHFIDQSDSSLFIKAVASLYYSYYLKPFEIYSEEMSILLFKKILAYNDIGPIAAMINFESLLNNKEEFEKNVLESQKNYDLTYFLLYMMNKTDEILDKTLDNIVLAQKEVVNNEFYQKEEIIIPTSKEDIKVERKTPINNLVEPIVEKNTINKNIVSNDAFLQYTKNIAINNVPEGLSEEEAIILENHLLEMNPSLSRVQAFFYARHCTLGMNYTISQFKKNLGCAYETARTSMDHLVFLGYYKKEMLRNKFIYTPVKKN